MTWMWLMSLNYIPKMIRRVNFVCVCMYITYTINIFKKINWQLKKKKHTLVRSHDSPGVSLTTAGIRVLSTPSSPINTELLLWGLKIETILYLNLRLTLWLGISMIISVQFTSFRVCTHVNFWTNILSMNLTCSFLPFWTARYMDYG